MAVIRNIKTMAFSGRIGDIVGCNGSKRSYIRSVPKKKQKEFSALQLTMHKKMAMATALLAPIRNLLEQSMTRRIKKNASGYGSAMSHLLQFGFTGEYPDLEINYAQLRISSGNLARTVVTMELKDNYLISLEWLKYPDYFEGDTDLASLLVYSEDKNEYAMERNLAERQDGKATYLIPEKFRNQKLHYYFFFHDNNFTKASATHYLGFTS